MTANSSSGSSASRVSPSVIEDVDNFALGLYRRARNGGPDFEDIAYAARNLHTVFRHLKIEVEDPESPLNIDNSAVYTRQLTPIIEDCEFTLKQLKTILDKYDSRLPRNDGKGSPTQRRTRMDGEMGWTMENVEREKINLIQSKLINQKLNLDMFLDTVQLRNSRSRKAIDPNSAGLDAIKDKVDAIAFRICQRRNSGLSENEEELWRRFKDELEREGFSREVLRKNKDVLRAYIRQLDERTVANGGATPSVRGFLERDANKQDADTRVVPHRSHPPARPDPKITYPDIDNETFFPTTKMKRLQSEDYGPPATVVHNEPTNLSYEPRSSDEDDIYASTDSAALISTRDLMALDKRSADLAMAMDNMNLQSATPAYTNGVPHAIAASPPVTRYLPPSASQPTLLPPSPPTTLDDQFGPSPHQIVSLPPTYGGGSAPAVRSSSLSTPALVDQNGEAPGQIALAQRASRLAPDSQGKEIPLEAKWTRIRRSLVSPEVLSQAGVRYEARPDFVAVLGTLTKEEIVEFARRSAEARKKRNSVTVGTRKERRPEDRYHPDKYRNWDVETASAKSPAGGGHVTNSGGRRPSQLSSSSELYDSTDDTSDSDTDHYLDRSGQPLPSNQSRRPSTPYHHSSSDRHDVPRHGRPRGDSGVSNVSIYGSSDEGDEKGTKAYPFVVPPPGDNAKESPSATTMPKPILKNKNDDPHVRLDPEPHVFDESKSSPRKRHGERERERDRDRDRDRHRERDGERERDRDRDREKKYHSDRYVERDRDRDRDRYVDRDRKDRDKHERERDRERERERDRRYHHSVSSAGTRRDRDGRSARKRGSTSDTLKAVGIGGAAASLLSVLTEAASGL